MKSKGCLCMLLTFLMVCGCFSVPAEAFDSSDSSEQMTAISERRATGKFTFDIPAKTMMEASTSFPMEYGETVTISAVYSPASASMDFGLIDSDGGFYPIRASGGSINKTIVIDQRGNYTFGVRNNSSYEVSVSGFVNY